MPSPSGRGREHCVSSRPREAVSRYQLCGPRLVQPGLCSKASCVRLRGMPSRRESIRGAAGEQDGILASSALMAAGTAFSRLSGFVRAFLLAAALGNLLHGDLFAIANTIPTMLYILLAGGILVESSRVVYDGPE